MYVNTIFVSDARRTPDHKDSNTGLSSGIVRESVISTAFPSQIIISHVFIKYYFRRLFTFLFPSSIFSELAYSQYHVLHVERTAP